MQQRLSMVTLGVEDVPRATAFYAALGWTVGLTDGDIVMFQAGPMVLALWSRAKLAADGGVAEGTGWGGFTLGHLVGSDAEVDELCGRAERAGARVTAPPRGKEFGYSGVFADPDGHTWEIARVEAWRLHDDGAVELPR